MLGTEPVRIIAAINGAIIATLGVLTLLNVLDEKVAGAIGIALAAWIQVAANFIVRPKVTPEAHLPPAGP